MCTIKPQTVRVTGGLDVVATPDRLYVRKDGMTWCLHLSPAGEVLRITRPLTGPFEECTG